ncbi:MAG TPA: bifunctional protein-serine/threonine kinase/phosphatase [Candidatus Sulfotelmatobacter sp.]|jgi:serine/threonine protein phosphatase PrpC|nr:bifunctional protein-serine/threonine kinase/phosphatase [Candidatus Sulfotelmatobacter sp.]
MIGGGSCLAIGIGIASETGMRRRNEDFAGAARPSPLTADRFGYALALADGMGGTQGGREAAETAVRGFLDGYYDKPQSWGVRRAASSVLESLNNWLHAVGRQGELAGMGCTFSGLVLRGRTAHVLHIGDSRLYRFSQGRLTLLTEDHCLKQPGLTHVLYRALGMEQGARLDYSCHPLELHDRFMICCDGVHGSLSDRRITDILARQLGPEETARALVTSAIEAGSQDNSTALVVDILALPPADRSGISHALAGLPIPPLPKSGDVVDGFLLGRQLSDGRYTRLFVAKDNQDGGPVVLKFPRPRAAADDVFKQAFLREAWVSAQIRSPHVGRVIELPAGRQSRLYAVMPLYEGETLEQRSARSPKIGLEEGRRIGVKLCQALAALHRAGVIHRDIKPDNVILCPDGDVKLIDLGVVRVPGLEEIGGDDIPGTPSFMAPEMFAGAAGDEASDLYALGASLFRAFTGHYPHGEIEPFSKPRFAKVRPLVKDRPDLPSWLDYTLGKAMALKPQERFADATEMLFALESGPAAQSADSSRRPSLYQRNPLLFWQATALVLVVLLLISLAR